MPVTLPLQEMTVAEKLEAMESLWEDLTRDAAELAVPEWHLQILEERERLIAAGEATFTDWEEAKTELWSRVS